LRQDFLDEFKIGDKSWNSGLARSKYFFPSSRRLNSSAAARMQRASRHERIQYRQIVARIESRLDAVLIAVK